MIGKKMQEKIGQALGQDMMKNLQKAQDDSNNVMKQLNMELQGLAELLNESLDSQNEIIKAEITNYQLMSAIADKLGVDKPKPLIKMSIE